MQNNNLEYTLYSNDLQIKKIKKINNYFYKINLNNNKFIKCSIDKDYYCCENFGIHLNIHDLKHFENANIKNINMSKIYGEEDDTYGYDITMKVDLILQTDKGDIKFIIYNCHNGYYSHNYNIILSINEETNICGKL